MIIPPRRQVVDKLMFSPLQKTSSWPISKFNKKFIIALMSGHCNHQQWPHHHCLTLFNRTFVAIIVRTVVKSLFQPLVQSLSELFLQPLQIQRLKIHQNVVGSVSLRLIYQPLKYLLLSVLMCSRSTIMLFVSSKCQHLP